MSNPEQPAEPVGAGSVSKLDCIASVRGKGEANVGLFRHLAPMTVNAITRELPMYGRANSQPGMVSMLTTIRIGVEKARITFEPGDVAFLPSGSLLCFFLEPAKSERPLNPLGKVESGLEVLAGVGPGDVISLAKRQSA